MEKGGICIKDFVKFGNFDSREFSIISVSQNSFDFPRFEADSFEFWGKNGTVYVEENRLSNIPLKYILVIDTSKGIDSVMTRLRTALLNETGYRTLYDSVWEDVFRLARLEKVTVNRISPTQNSVMITLNFNAKPQRYLNHGNTPVDVDIRPAVIPILRNPTECKSVPLIKFVPSQQNGHISFGSTISADDFRIDFKGLEIGKEFTFDGETLDLIDENGTFMNEKVYSSDIVLLSPGNNWFGVKNIDSLIIVPRWWEL